MTEETPSEPRLRALRARLFQRIVHRVVIDDTGTGTVRITIEGHLVPPGADPAECAPLAACGDILVAYTSSREGAGRRQQFSTDLPPLGSKSVLTHYGNFLTMEPTRAAERRERASLSSSSWVWRRNIPKEGVPSWRTEFGLVAG